jgi:hypothetical protein
VGLVLVIRAVRWVIGGIPLLERAVSGVVHPLRLPIIMAFALIVMAYGYSWVTNR